MFTHINVCVSMWIVVPISHFKYRLFYFFWMYLRQRKKNISITRGSRSLSTSTVNLLVIYSASKCDQCDKIRSKDAKCLPSNIQQGS